MIGRLVHRLPNGTCGHLTSERVPKRGGIEDLLLDRCGDIAVGVGVDVGDGIHVDVDVGGVDAEDNNE